MNTKQVHNLIKTNKMTYYELRDWVQGTKECAFKRGYDFGLYEREYMNKSKIKLKDSIDE